MFRLRVAAIILVLVCVALPSTEASIRSDSEIWTGVLLATNESSPKSPPDWLAPFLEQLRNVFGYNQFEVIGRHVKKMASGDSQWLIPTRQFFLEVQTRQSRGGTCRLRFTLWHEKKIILKTEARVMPGSPLFVRGPQYGRGQLIFVVEVR